MLLSTILVHLFIYDYRLHCRRKHFYRYCTSFLTKEISKHHVKDCLKISSEQRIKIPIKGERKIKSSFFIYADFESILVLEDNEKQNPKESNTNKYRKCVACSYGYKLIKVYDKFSEPFNSNLGQDAVYSFINSTIKESKYCTHMVKKYFNKECAMAKEHEESFENSTNRWICGNVYVDDDGKVTDHNHITVKYRYFS